MYIVYTYFQYYWQTPKPQVSQVKVTMIIFGLRQYPVACPIIELPELVPNKKKYEKDGSTMKEKTPSSSYVSVFTFYSVTFRPAH